MKELRFYYDNLLEDGVSHPKLLTPNCMPNDMGITFGNYGFMVTRATGINNFQKIEKDFKNTLKTWEEIGDKALNSNAPSLVYEEGDIIKRTLRDTYDNETKNVYIHGNDAYQKAKKFMKELIVCKSLLI